MIVLAVLLLLVAALVVLFVVATGITPTVVLEWSQINTSVTLTALAVFLLGAATLLVAEAGLGLLLRGNRKSWERRRELKRLQRVEAERARHQQAGGSPRPTRQEDPAGRDERKGPAASPAAPGGQAPGRTDGGSTRS